MLICLWEKFSEEQIVDALREARELLDQCP